VTGLVGGILVNVFGQSPEDGGLKTEGRVQATEDGGRQSDPVVPLGKRIVDGLKHGFITLPRNIGKPLLIGLVVAGVISALVPDDFFADRLGKGLRLRLGVRAGGGGLDPQRPEPRRGTGLSHDGSGDERRGPGDDLERPGPANGDPLPPGRSGLFAGERPSPGFPHLKR
jgi:hypothetical protein